MAESKKQSPKFTTAMIEQMLTLATAGFGLAAGLAWNSLIQATIDLYVRPFLPSGAKLLSQFIYALIVTLLAVMVTYNLSKVLQRFAETEKKEAARKRRAKAREEEKKEKS